MRSGIRTYATLALLQAFLPTLTAAQDDDPYRVGPPPRGTYQPSEPAYPNPIVVDPPQSDPLSAPDFGPPPGLAEPAPQGQPRVAPQGDARLAPRGDPSRPSALDVDRVMDRVKACWTAIPAVYGTPAQGGVARIRVKFTPDGALDGAPMIIDKPQGNIGTKFATSAAQAIVKCAPYRLPPERYNEWRQIEMKFDTIDPDDPPRPPPAPAAAQGEIAPDPGSGGSGAPAQ